MKVAQICVMLASAPAFLGLPAAWVGGPVDCAARAAEADQLHQAFFGESRQRQWSSHRRGVAEAVEGGPLYAPAPFPESQEEILRNVEYAYFQRLFDDPHAIPTDELPIYKGMLSDAFTFRILRVENWGVSRCALARPVPYYDLVRAYDQHGQELVRFAMHQSGLLARYAHVTTAAREQAPDIGRVVDNAAGALGLRLRPQDVKFVVTDGLPVRCDPILPCAVLESQGTTYLWNRGDAIYAFDQSSARRSVTEKKNQELRVMRSGKLASFGAKPGAASAWISAGFEWVKARRVWPAP